MAFPEDILPEMREWIKKRGTRVQQEWLRLHDRAKPKGLLERLKPEVHAERLKKEGLEQFWR